MLDHIHRHTYIGIYIRTIKEIDWKEDDKGNVNLFKANEL